MQGLMVVGFIIDEILRVGLIRAVAGQHARLLLTFVKHKAKPDQ